MIGRILVVDDDARLRLLYREELSREDYDVVCVDSGRAALELPEQEPFDLAIVDIEMPDMSGLDLVVALRERVPEMAIVVNSAYSIYKSDFKSWMADAYMVKTSDLNPLKAKITELLEMK
jgi:DNA-binding response OmpR family regulator